MALTDPFPPDVESWLEESIQHLYRVRIIPQSGPSFDVAVDGRLDLTYDAQWSPYAQVTFRIKTPTDPEQLAALDTRLFTRVEVYAGYRRAGVNHLPLMGRLRLQTAVMPYPGGTTEITAYGRDIMLHDQTYPKEPVFTNGDGSTSYGFTWTNRNGVVAFLVSWLNQMYPDGQEPEVGTTLEVTGEIATQQELVAQYRHHGGTIWNAVGPVARSAGLRLYDTGLDQWRIDLFLPAKLGTEYAARLQTGKRGTMTTADVRLDRSEWFNEVAVEWHWEEEFESYTNQKAIYGNAQVTSGPLRVTYDNRKMYREIREGPVTQAYATAYARGLLRSYMLRGRYREVTAVATYWLRPGMTILVRFGRGSYTPTLVTAVTFSPLTGSMNVRTARPEDYETS